MTTPRQLHVHYTGHRVGTLTESATGTMSFAYASSWLQNPRAFPISVSMSLTGAVYDTIAHNWFANLLPEGAMRTTVARRLKISATNDFALLQALGGECAGALTLDTGEPVSPGSPTSSPVTDSDILRWIRSPQELPLGGPSDGIRLSLAGAQDKIPVIYQDDCIFLPGPGAPSTHILKLPNRDYRQLPENEFLITKLAVSAGIPTHEIILKRIDKIWVSVSRRYDRSAGPDGAVHRLHQEDFCQALGLPAARKYEDDGGPDLATCINLAANVTPRPVVAVNHLIRWTIFNALVGNCDAHAKNLSFLWQPDGSIALAPFYDLVCTMAYDQLDRKLALGIGGQRDPAFVAGPHWREMAQAISVKPRVVTDEVLTMCDHLEKNFKPTLKSIQESGASLSKSADIQKVLNTQIRRVRDQIAKPGSSA